MDKGLVRAMVLAALGGFYFLGVLYFPPARNNALILSFGISVFAGFFSPNLKSAVLALILFVFGAAFGVVFAVLVKAGFATPTVEKGQLLYLMIKVALLTQFVGVLPWFVGFPIGLVIRRKLIRHSRRKPPEF